MSKKEGLEETVEATQTGTVSSNQESSRRRLYWKWSGLMLVFTLAILASLYTISAYSEVQDVSVEGTTEVYDQEVFNYSSIALGDSVLGTYFGREEIESRIIEAIPQVSDAELNVTGLQSVTITVSEFETVAFLQTEDLYQKILENGVILDETMPRITSSQPILLNFTQGEALDRMLATYEEVEEQVRSLISEIEHLDDSRNPMLVRAFMNDGNEVIASIPTFAERLNYYLQMRETVDEQGVFDLEAGAFFIPYDSEEYEAYENDNSQNNMEQSDE